MIAKYGTGSGFSGVMAAACGARQGPSRLRQSIPADAPLPRLLACRPCRLRDRRRPRVLRLIRRPLDRPLPQQLRMDPLTVRRAEARLELLVIEPQLPRHLLQVIFQR